MLHLVYLARILCAISGSVSRTLVTTPETRHSLDRHVTQRKLKQTFRHGEAEFWLVFQATSNRRQRSWKDVYNISIRRQHVQSDIYFDHWNRFQDQNFGTRWVYQGKIHLKWQIYLLSYSNVSEFFNSHEEKWELFQVCLKLDKLAGTSNPYLMPVTIFQSVFAGKNRASFVPNVMAFTYSQMPCCCDCGVH